MTLGQWKGISFIVITSNLEFNSTCWKKKHSQFHWNTFTWPEPLIQSWTCCKDNVLTIIGVSMWIEVCQILGKDSQSSLYLKRNLQRDVCGPGERLTKIQANYQTWLFVAWNMVKHVKSSSVKEKAAVGYRKTKARECSEHWEACISSIRKREFKATIRKRK